MLWGVVAAFILLTLVAVWIALPLFKSPAENEEVAARLSDDMLDRQQMFANQLADLEADRRAGLIGEDDYQAALSRLREDIQILQKEARSFKADAGPLAVLLTLLLLVQAGPVGAQLPAETGGSIRGRLVVLDKSTTVPPDAEVELHPFRKGKAGPTFHAPIDAQGHFEMRDLLVHPDIRYWFSVKLQGAEYHSNVVVLSQKDSQAYVEIPIFPAAGKNPGITVTVDHCMLKVEQRSADVLELVAVDVSGDTGYMGGSDGGLLIPLPTGFGALEQVEGSVPVIERAGKGVLLMGPLPPGRSAVAFEYRLPISGDSASFRRQWPTSVGRFGVFLENAGPRLDTAMVDEGLKDVNGKSYHVYAVADVNPMQTVSFTLGNLPKPPPDWRIAYAVGLGTALAAVFLVGLRRKAG